MRLTLRTLLAYIDQQLNKEDAEEISGKIEKSDFARRLQRRINMLSSRRNVPAPLVQVRGVGEANAVSEYIDGAMASDKIPDFEKACLESDIHLCEVAACHTILTRLGEPEEVTPELRRRIYLLDKFPVEGTVSDSDSNVNIENHSAIAERFVDSGEERIVSSRDVFELSAPSGLPNRESDSPSDDLSGALRSSKPSTKVRYRVLPALAAAASLLLLTFLILLATMDRGGTDLSESTSREVIAPGDATNPTDRTTLDREDESAADFKPGDRSVEMKPRPKPSGARSLPQFEKPAIADPASTDFIQGPSESKTADASSQTLRMPETEASPAEIIASESKLPDTSPSFPAAESKFSQLAFFGVIPVEPGLEVAKVTAGKQLLVRADPTAESWEMVSNGTPVYERQFLMSFPYFRPSISFTQIELTACDNGVFQLLPVSRESVSGISIQYGRFLLKNNGGGFNEFALLAGDVKGTVTLQQNDSVVAIEVRRFLPPGIDPKSLLAANRIRTELALTTVSGRSMWEDDSDALQLDPLVTQTIVPGGTPVSTSIESLPNWAIGENTTEIEPADTELLVNSLLESTVGEQATMADIKAGLQAISSRPETNVRVRQLAMLCQLQLGDASIIGSLLDSDDPAFIRPWLWRRAIEGARRHVYRGTASASEFGIRMAAADPDGEKIFRVLYGFDNDQLAGGADALLIETLKSERLALRVLALQALREITGETLLYRPEVAQRNRARHLESWRQTLDAGKIRH